MPDDHVTVFILREVLCDACLAKADELPLSGAHATHHVHRVRALEVRVSKLCDYLWYS